MATDSFTSSAVAVAAPSATLSTGAAGGVKTFTFNGGFEITVNSKGVYISKATSFGGTQVALTFPITLQEGRALALELMGLVN